VHGAWGNWPLLVGSVVFYAKGGGQFTWLMLGLIAFNYGMAIGVAPIPRYRRVPSAGSAMPLGSSGFAARVNAEEPDSAGRS
jgi:hypothetical protein